MFLRLITLLVKAVEVLYKLSMLCQWKNATFLQCNYFFVRHKCQKQLSFELEKSFRNEDFADVKARQYRDAPRNPTDRISGRRFRPYFIYLAFSVSGYQKCPDICHNMMLALITKVRPSSCGCFL